ncbi:MAG: glycosyltransferase family 2 protein [Bacteroidota bacterium]
MFTICIPTYNYDISPLVNDLHNQGVLLDADFEILVVDDASDEKYQKKNLTVSTLDHVKYHQLPENIGRSRIRNLCASMATFQWIIFMDCDSKCPDGLYLKRYAQQTKSDAKVICGGRLYMDAPLENNTYLHWHYGRNREVRNAKQRNKEPFRSFMTNNFMLRKDVFNQIRFNEDLKGYGHEDTLFGIELSEKNMPLFHIDNPLLHIGLQNDKEFLDKTRQAVFNLVFIYNCLNNKTIFSRHVRLISAFEMVRKIRLVGILAFLFPYFQTAIEKQLKSGKPRLWLLDMYKLGVFCQAYKYKREDQ